MLNKIKFTHIFLSVGIVFLFLFSSNSFSQEPQQKKIMVFDLREPTEFEEITFVKYLSIALLDTSFFRIIPKEVITEFAQKKNIQLNFENVDEFKKVSKGLKADYILSGDVSLVKYDKSKVSLKVTINIYDAKTLELLTMIDIPYEFEKIGYSGSKKDLLQETLNLAAQKVAQNIVQNLSLGKLSVLSSGKQFFVDKGSDDGIKQADVFVLLRGQENIGTAKVEKTFAKESLLEITELKQGYVLQTGDMAVPKVKVLPVPVKKKKSFFQKYKFPLLAAGVGIYFLTQKKSSAAVTSTTTSNLTTISGKVLDSVSTSGITEAYITLNNGQSQATDSSGNFSFTNLAAATYTLTITKTAYTSTTTSVTTTAGATSRTDVVLSKVNTGTLRGTVTDATTGLPISSATVTAGPVGGNVTSTTTDSAGAFVFQNLLISLVPGGTNINYVVSAAKTGYASLSVSAVTLLATETKITNLSLGTVNNSVSITSPLVTAPTALVSPLADGTVLSVTVNWTSANSYPVKITIYKSGDISSVISTGGTYPQPAFTTGTTQTFSVPLNTSATANTYDVKAELLLDSTSGLVVATDISEGALIIN